MVSMLNREYTTAHLPEDGEQYHVRGEGGPVGKVNIVVPFIPYPEFRFRECP